MARVIQAISPIDGQVLGDFEVSTLEQISQAVSSAHSAALTWQAVPVKQRSLILARFKPILLAELDAVCGVISRTTGKVLTEALLGEVYPVLDLVQYYEKHAAQILRDKNITTSPFAFPGATAQITRLPYGVVAIISPWNYPFQITVTQILSALFAGNAVIFKPSELSLPVGQLIMGLFARLDLPEGLLQWLIGDGQCGEQLIDAAPDLLVFTGSLNTGRAVMQRAAQHLMPLILELGGKDAMIVFDDANLSRARDGALYGAFCNSGQACVSVERLYVQQSCYQNFLKLLVEGSVHLKMGHGAEGDLGAMTSKRQIEIVQKHYDDALAKGAKASCPLNETLNKLIPLAVRQAHHEWSQHLTVRPELVEGLDQRFLNVDGNYLNPVVLWDVTPDMLIMQEETFGPLLPVIAFADETEAVQLANNSEFGLNASVWSQDIIKAERVAKQLLVGNWAVNDVIKNIGHPGLPFGGVKKSGFGRYHGAEGLRNFTYPVSGLTSRSHLPKEPNWFPYSQAGYQDFKGYIDFVYGTGSLYQRGKRNWQALQAFRDYSAFDLKQRWQNLLLMLPWKRDF